ncbi:MAG TPA: asparagine synthase-related protein [Candidatus Dormibacteraeota bacterium]|nr:asparagine synthase-related protein [Candidatus Dormibacteraeota bacterium]
MSGIVGIFHRNGAPVERALLQTLLQFLSYRGPDSQRALSDGPIGLGNAMLRTTYESENEQQPRALDGRFWITADARLDCRAELLAELQRAGRKVELSVPDSELILHAYVAWGTSCVDHLRGDFSFAIWDVGHKQLFCARDHFGIRPFYYAELGDLFLFSNTLNCIRSHPRVSTELNDMAIGDFLLFGLNYDNASTMFHDVQRLPPAHWLTVSANGLKIKRYWKPPTDGRIRYSKVDDYVENFLVLLQAAVADRLRTERVGILLSGGLDSPSVAAVAKELATKCTQSARICGYTFVYESLIPDHERSYAREVGEFLRIPVKFQAMDGVQLFEGLHDPELSLPEPIDNPLFGGFLESWRLISADCRVLLCGEGSDNLMHFQMWPHITDLRRNGEWQRLLTETANYLWVRPFPWRGIRARLLRLVGREPGMLVFPPWLAADFAKRLHLRERWKQHSRLPKSRMAHPIHPMGHASLLLPQWTNMFELENAGVKPHALEVRYPFLDLRIVNYLLALPPFPWFFQKMLLREAMAGRLPERVRVRPKTPLQADPVPEQIRQAGAELLNRLCWTADIDRYVDRARLVPPHAKMKAQQICSNLRPYCLNIWMQSRQGLRYKVHAEAGNG